MNQSALLILANILNGEQLRVLLGVSLEIGNYCTLSLFFEQIALSQ